MSVDFELKGTKWQKGGKKKRHSKLPHGKAHTMTLQGEEKLTLNGK